MKRVLFVLHGVGQFGSARYMFEIVQELDRRRFEPHIVTSTAVEPTDHYYPRLNAIGVPVSARLRTTDRSASGLVPGRLRAIRQTLGRVYQWPRTVIAARDLRS